MISGLENKTRDGVEHLSISPCFKETQFRLYVSGTTTRSKHKPQKRRKPLGYRTSREVSKI